MNINNFFNFLCKIDEFVIMFEILLICILSNLYNKNIKKYECITEHISEMVGVSSNLTSGLEFKPWKCSCVLS